MKQVGIVGAPYAGKTTLFNALTNAGATPSKANVAVVPVPDERVDVLTRLHASRKSVYAQVKFVDIASLSAQALGQLREMDALLVVVRGYGEDAKPEAELADVMTELALADLVSISGASDRIAKRARAGDKAAAAEAEVLSRARDILESGRPLRDEKWELEEYALFRDFAPLTMKPALLVVNVEDEQRPESTAQAATLAAGLGPGAIGVAVPARLEAEAGGLPNAEADELLAGYGVETRALPSVIAAAYQQLTLVTFLTTGEDESRAWEVRHGATAPEAAGVIHTDLQRGFIRAEVATYEEIVRAGSWDNAKSAGKLRVEGRDYVVEDGDVLNVRFAV